MPTKTRAAHAPRAARPLRALGLYGLDHLDAIVLAALASEAPLLLIGPHGSAKSALLNRAAAALGLDHRHYNASLVSFDDLLGFPVPNDARDGLQYLRTPATLWGAQSVFLDEISRCRPEVQNKLFSIVHERRAMGVELEALRYRWAAMNPPAAFDDAGDLDDAYLGSQPLDPALADRFAFLVALPALADIAPEARRLLIAHGDDAPARPGGPAGHADDAARAGLDGGLAALVASTRSRVALSIESYDAWVTGYVDALVAPLVEAKLAISGRRAATLRRSIHFVHAAREALEACEGPRSSRRETGIEDAALEALRWGLPQRAQGRAPAESALLALHRHAVELAGEPLDSPLARLRGEADPLRRIALALALPEDTLSRTAFSALVSDAFAAQDLPGRYLLARHLLPRLAERDAVNAPTLEMLAAPLGRLLDFERDPAHRMQLTRAELARFNAMLAAIAKLDPSDERQASLGNLLYTLFAVERANFDAGEVIARDARLARLFERPAARVRAPRAGRARLAA
jgi:MoxR-like ATPase